MHRLKKMDRERLAEAIGTRLDVSANTLRSPEIPVVARTSKKRNSDNGLEQTKNESDLDYDWTFTLQITFKVEGVRWIRMGSLVFPLHIYVQS